MAPRLRRVPSAVVELLRLCVVVFFAGLGYYVAELLDDSGEPVLGAFNVLGARADPRVGARLRAGRRPGPRHASPPYGRPRWACAAKSAEQIVAGVVGAVVGVLVAAGVTWPVLLLDKPLLTFPIFAFVLVALGLLGYRLGSAKPRGGARHVRRPGRAWPSGRSPPSRCRA